MKRVYVPLIWVLLFGVSCTSNKAVGYKKTHKTETHRHPTKIPDQASKIIDYALSFKGVKYKYGGTNKKGMDCSGLMVRAFHKYGVPIPRTSLAQSKFGHWIDLKKARPGDLLFFATSGSSRKISHVGLLTAVGKDRIEFVHTSTSEGVTVSSLDERYWYFAFVQARRVL